MQTTLKIWILDSGMWGHYALIDIRSHFPQYEYETYLDHSNAPYGNKSGEEIFRLAEAGCKTLWEKWCGLILIACNTICAETLRKLQDTHTDKKILGCIIPSVEVAVEISQQNIWLLATQFTIDSQKYDREIVKLSPTHKLYGIAAPELAGFIEQGMADHNYTLAYLERRVDMLLEKNIDTLILWCTHYTVFHEHLTLKYPKLKIVDSARTQTIKLWKYLRKHSEIFLQELGKSSKK